MKLRIKGLTEDQLRQQAPEILLKAANAMNVVLVEKEPAFEDKSHLPHTIKLVAQLEDWYFSQVNYSLDDLKNELVKRVGGTELNEVGVVNRTQLEPKKPAKTSFAPLAKSRFALVHISNIMGNPNISEDTKKQLYERAKQIMQITKPKDRSELLDVFLGLRDLL
jgi:hypothetical protein